MSEIRVPTLQLTGEQIKGLKRRFGLQLAGDAIPLDPVAGVYIFNSYTYDLDAVRQHLTIRNITFTEE